MVGKDAVLKGMLSIITEKPKSKVKYNKLRSDGAEQGRAGQRIIISLY
jgi:hypothetical protein